MKPWDARLAHAFVRPLRHRRVHPNHLTTVSLLLGLAAAVTAAQGPQGFDLAALLLILSALADHADGELARMTGKSSAFGHYYDVTSDGIVKVLFFLGLGWGLRSGTLGALAPWLGLAAGVSIAAIFLLWQRAESQHGKTAVAQPAWGGFEAEDALYIVGPVLWSGAGAWFLASAALGRAVVRPVVRVEPTQPRVGTPFGEGGPRVTTLVTGATGFVGSAIARALLARGQRVRVLVRRASDRRNLEGLDVELRQGDLEDPESLERAVEGCRALFHAAADYRLWVPDPDVMYARNVEGTRALMRAALKHGLERVVYTSSVAVLGLLPGGEPADEDTPSSLEEMIGPYKRSKFLAEAVVRDMVRDDGLPAVIVNPSAPVGPRDIKPTPTGRMVLDAATNKMPAYVDTGLNVVHVDDVAEGHALALERGAIGERYILGGENMSLRRILAEVARIAGTREPRVRLAPAVLAPVAWGAEAWARRFGGEPRVTRDALRMSRKRMYFKSDKARRELGYAARVATAALEDAVAWFRRAGYTGAERP